MPQEKTVINFLRSQCAPPERLRGTKNQNPPGNDTESTGTLPQEVA